MSFSVAGLSHDELNVAYSERGEFGGQPLYRGSGSSAAGMYWLKSNYSGKWAFVIKYTEEEAKAGRAHATLEAVHDEVKAVLLGQFGARCWTGAEWQDRRVTVAALTAEDQAGLEKAFRAALLAAIEGAEIYPARALRICSGGYCDDREVVLAAAAKDGSALEHASPALRADRELVLRAAGFDNTDRTAVLAAVNKGAWVLSCASEVLRADQDVVLAAVARDGRALEYASEVLRASREFVLTAVTKNRSGSCLQYASEPLKSDKEFVAEALAKNLDALMHAPNAFKTDKEFVLGLMGDAKGYRLSVSGFSHGMGINGIYEQRGEFGGQPLYRKCGSWSSLPDEGIEWGDGGKEAGMYWSDPQLSWIIHLQYTEKEAKAGRANATIKPPGGVKAVPLGEHAARNWSGGEWLDQQVTVTACGGCKVPIILKWASDALKTDREVVLEAVSSYGSALQHASSTLKADREVVLAATAQSYLALTYAAPELQEDEAVLLSARQQLLTQLEELEGHKVGGYTYQAALHKAAPALRIDRELVQRVKGFDNTDREQVLAVARKNAEDMEFVPDAFLADTSFVLSALRGMAEVDIGGFLEVGKLVKQLPAELRADKDVALAAVVEGGYGIFNEFSEALQDDKEVVLTVVAHRGDALQYASERLRADPEVQLVAATEGGSLEYVSEELRSDPEIVKAVLVKDASQLEHASEALRGDPGVVYVAAAHGWFQKYMLHHCGSVVRFASDALRADEFFMKKAGLLEDLGCNGLNGNGPWDAMKAFKAAPADLRADKLCALTAVKHCGDALQYASETLQDDKEVVLTAVAHCGDALQYASETLRADPEVQLVAAKEGGSLEYVSEELRSDPEIVKAVLVKDASQLELASEALRSDPEIMLAVFEAVRNSGELMDNIAPALLADKDFMLAALALSTTSGKLPTKMFRAAQPQLLADRDFVLEALASLPTLQAAGCSASRIKLLKKNMLSKYAVALQTDEQVVVAVVAQYGRAIQHASVALKAKREVALAAVAQTGTALKFVSAELQSDPDVKRLAALDKDERLLPRALLRAKLFGHLRYVPTMLDQKVTVASLPRLDHLALQHLGMQSLLERMDFMEAVRELGPEPEPEDSSDNSSGEEPEPEPVPEDEVGVPPRTFATSNFKREYAKPGIPIVQSVQVFSKLFEFMFTYCQVNELTAPSVTGCIKRFHERLMTETANDGACEMLGEVGATAELLWTSAKKFEDMAEHSKELCSLINAALREDHPDLAPLVVPMVHAINDHLCVTRRTDVGARRYPVGGITYRGGGFGGGPELRAFFIVGKQYRVPGFLATSFDEAVAIDFRDNIAVPPPGGSSIMWVVSVDPQGETVKSKRCMHVNFVMNSHIKDAAGNPREAEFLFAPYSIFTVRSVTWGPTEERKEELRQQLESGGLSDEEVAQVRAELHKPHRIEIDAASDNNPAAEGGDGRWATPVGSEDLPLAPWY